MATSHRIEADCRALCPRSFACSPARRSARWSPWFYLGCWGQTLGMEPRVIKDDAGKVDIDTLILRRPADAYQARVTFYSLNLDARMNPALRRLAISYSGIVRDAAEREK